MIGCRANGVGRWGPYTLSSVRPAAEYALGPLRATRQAWTCVSAAPAVLPRQWEVSATSASIGAACEYGAPNDEAAVTESFTVWVGIDWGAEEHRVWVTAASGACLGERRVAHRGVALLELAEWLVSLAGGHAAAIAVALETPRGPVVDLLIERGCVVFALNPKQLDRFRDRWSAAGAKDDRRDAEVLANALRTDPRAFCRLEPDDPLTVQLREAVRQDAELTEDLRRAANRLREHLVRVWPELLALAPAADEPWFWTVLDLAPAPHAAARIRPARLRQLLREHHIRRVTAEEVLVVLRTPSVHLAAGVREGVLPRITDLIEQLRILHAQRRRAERRMADTLVALAETPTETGREHPDVTVLQSLPGIGVRIAARMLADAARPLRARDYHALRVLVGVAPVTKQSGKSRLVRMRHACHHPLRAACHAWAQVSIRDDPRSRAHYQQLRARGHNHARALRGVVDRLLALLIAMLRTNTLYEATRWAAQGIPA